MAVESISNKIWTPDATILSSTADSELQASNAASIPKFDPGTQEGVSRADESAHLYPDNTSNNQALADTSENLSFCHKLREYYNSKFGNKVGMNQKVFTPEQGNMLKYYA